MLLTAINESNGELQHWGMGTERNGKICFSFAPNTKATTVTLTFAVHQSRYADFEVMPAVVSTNFETAK